jgi:Tfp pilus assembly protein PilF
MGILVGFLSCKTAPNALSIRAAMEIHFGRKVPQHTILPLSGVFRFVFKLSCTILAACLSCAAADNQWAEVRSQHFRVITDGSESAARRVAREFEQIRFAMSSVYPKLRLDSGAPLLVICPRDEASLKTLAPQFWKGKGFKPAGFFQHGWDKEYAMVRLDEIRPQSYEVVYHEYVHSVMHLNIHWLPVWLDEGLADFHANTRFEKNKIYIGAPSWRGGVLRSRTPIPLATLLAVTPSSPYYHDEDKAGLFYAESWMLTHYLFFGPGMESGKKLLRFVNLLDQKEQLKAFEEVFGDPKAVEKALEQYSRNFTLAGGYLNSPASTDEKEFKSRRMSAAETEAELASYHLWSHQRDLARPLIEQALKEDPKLGLAHEDLAFLNFAEGKDTDAVREFKEAVTLDPKLYLSLFSLTMMSPAAASDAAADHAEFERGLLKVLEENPQFAPALVQLAKLYLHQGNLEKAFTFARKAEELEPTRAGYHLLCGRILQLRGHGPEAAGFAKFVATRWQGPDHDEALELWNSVPAAERPAGEAMMASVVAGTQVAEGAVKSVHCGRSVENEEQKYTLVIEQGGHELAFQPKGGFAVGYSDTLWWGRDHFSSCLHINGVRAIVHYRPSADPKYAGELARLDLRDEVPQLPLQPKRADSSLPAPKSANDR